MRASERSRATPDPLVLQSEDELTDEPRPWAGAGTEVDRAIIVSLTGAPPGDGPVPGGDRTVWERDG